MKPETTNAILVIEDLTGDHATRDAASKELAEIITAHCGGLIEVSTLHKDNSTAIF